MEHFVLCHWSYLLVVPQFLICCRNAFLSLQLYRPYRVPLSTFFVRLLPYCLFLLCAWLLCERSL
ncbi:hypothetical protein JHK86_029750 [Glycine max]|nr:hypothetical protein JHK86_029750 [Glycine max]